MPDTDGDGLTDHEELNEPYTVRATKNASASRTFMEALQAEEVNLEKIEGAMASETVTSNPLTADSNGDGFDDAQNRRAGTNPWKRDTTGDGIPDWRALEMERADPTLFDYVGPRINVTDSTFYKPRIDWKTTYLVTFTVEDESGLGTVTLLKDRDVFWRDEPTRQWKHYASKFSTGSKETFFDAYNGATVTVRATDKHGNVNGALALERSNFFGHIASKMDRDSIYAPRVAIYLGVFSGISKGFGELLAAGRSLAAVAQMLIDDWKAVVAAAERLLSRLTDLGLLGKMITNLPAAISQQQKSINPYEEGTKLYDEFRAGYYEGYIWYFVAETIATGGAARALSSSTKFTSVVTKVDKLGLLRGGYRAYTLAGHALSAPVVIAGVGMARAVARLAPVGAKAVRSVYAGVRTVGKQVSLRSSIRQLDAATIRRMSPARQRMAGRLLGATDGDGYRTLSDWATGATRRIHRSDPSADVLDHHVELGHRRTRREGGWQRRRAC